MSESAGQAGGRECRDCHEPLRVEVLPEAVYCSAVCRARSWRKDRRLRLRTAAETRGAGLAECPVCGVRWVMGVNHRSNAVYCSRTCKVRAWRERARTYAER